jgi:hypothetical protein
VDRVNLELFFKFQGSEYKNLDHGLILKQYMGPFCKVARIIQFLNYFLMEKLCGPGPQLMDHDGGGPWWTLDRGSAMTSLELSLMAALGHGGSLVIGQRRERSTGSPSRASSGHGQRCGDRATVLKKWQW